MKKFILRTAIFLVTASLVPITYLSYLFITNKYESVVIGHELYVSIKKSKQKSKKKKLILGDSVAKQMGQYNRDTTNTNSLACNQAISMVGQYLLFKNYLSAGNKIDTVILLVNPTSLKSNLNQIFTFHYFLKPFYKEEYKTEFSDNVYKQIKKIPFYEISQFPLVTASNWSPDFKSKDPQVKTFLSPVSWEYILRIKRLAESNNITFLIYPNPMRASLKSSMDSISETNLNIAGLEKEFGLYFKKVKYIDDQNFVDYSHFKKSYLAAHPNLLTEVLHE